MIKTSAFADTLNKIPMKTKAISQWNNNGFSETNGFKNWRIQIIYKNKNWDEKNKWEMHSLEKYMYLYYV